MHLLTTFSVGLKGECCENKHFERLPGDLGGVEKERRLLGTLLLHFLLVPRALLTQDTWQHLRYRRNLAAAQSKRKCTQYSRPPPLAHLARTPERWLGVPLCFTTDTEASESSTIGTNSKAAGEATDTQRCWWLLVWLHPAAFPSPALLWALLLPA